MFVRKEISQYLKRVREENKSRPQVTSAFVTKRIAELVSSGSPKPRSSAKLLLYRDLIADGHPLPTPAPPHLKVLYTIVGF